MKEKGRRGRETNSNNNKKKKARKTERRQREREREKKKQGSVTTGERGERETLQMTLISPCTDFLIRLDPVRKSTTDRES